MKITENLSGIPEEKLFALAERENNPKRRNLLVSLRQAKHFPALPSEALGLFRMLGKRVKKALPKGRNLVIAFAETATALGAAAAAEIAGITGNHCDNGGGNVYFIHTTRESFPEEMLVADFSEEHSHAACQLLFSGNGKEIFDGIDNIIFIDDEFTTGKTIVNFVNAIKDRTGNCRFFAASLINGMDRENLRRFEEFGVTPLWLIKTEDSGADMERDLKILPERDIAKCSADMEIITDDYSIDPRLGCDIGEYMRLCKRIAESVLKNIGEIPGDIAGNIAVIGTEECMLPSIILGKFLEESGKNVRCRSTTRSPIVPSAAGGYPLNSRCCFDSPYEKGRRTFLYNSSPCDLGIIVTDSKYGSEHSQNAIKEIAGALQAKRVIVVILKREYPKRQCKMELVKTSYKSEDVCILLKDISGLVEPQPASVRERLIQSGVHYCEMLPLEYEPSDDYIAQYEAALINFSMTAAEAVAVVSEKIYRKYGENVCLVSLARAGISAGVLIKHYIKKKYGTECAHYAISIIRGRGIDKNAMNYILQRHCPTNICFVDGWTGKGAIAGQLQEAMKDYPAVDPTVAVIADPAGITPLCGTHDDFLIASSCLNSVVSGLISRTFLRSDIIGKDDFHGAAYYGNLADRDRTYEFINAVESCMKYDDIPEKRLSDELYDNREQLGKIAEAFGVSDINLIKPGIGETTRVLLRRIPDRVLIAQGCDRFYISHILRLAEEKGVRVEEYPLTGYRCCGIIKNMPADT